MGRADDLEIHQNLAGQVLGPSKLEKPLASCSGVVAMRSRQGSWALGSVGGNGELRYCYPRVFWEGGRWHLHQHNVAWEPQVVDGAIEIPRPDILIWRAKGEVYPGLRLVRRKATKSLQCVLVDSNGVGLMFSDDETLGYIEFYSALEIKRDVSGWLRATMEDQSKLLKELK